jgi:1,2-diacylglycerol 3-alpha-glucosyltransferase
MADLLVITPGFPRDEADDGCIPPLQAYVRTYAELYPQAVIRVIATQYPFHREPYSWHGIQVFPCGGANRRWSKPLSWQRALALGARLHRERPIGRVHSLWLGECAWLGQRIARQCNAAHVVTLQGQDARDERWWWRLVKNGSSRFAVLSQRHAEVFTAMSGRAQDAIIPWGLDPRDASTSPEQDIDLLFAGSLIPVKRPEIFIEAVARIARQRPVNAVMAGARIPAGNTLVDRLVAEAGLVDTIQVLGEVSRKEVLKLMARSRVLVHPSAFESQGYVFLEALMQGMSITSFPVGIAEAGAHWQVVNDVEQLVTAVEELLERPAPASTFVPFTIGATVEAYDHLFRT